MVPVMIFTAETMNARPVGNAFFGQNCMLKSDILFQIV